jgi:hypothetical protein
VRSGNKVFWPLALNELSTARERSSPLWLNRCNLVNENSQFRTLVAVLVILLVGTVAASASLLGSLRKVVTWLILPVVICLSQRLSHACLSINKFVL